MSDKGRKSVIVIEDPSEPLAERLAAWLNHYSSAIGYIAGGLVISFFILYFWGYRTVGQDEKDYIQAEVSFSEFSATPPGEVDPATNLSYLALKTILDSHPELASRYNGLIAQNFLRLGDMKMALVYGQLALKDLSDENLPFYEDYSKTSLLIADGNYSEALKRSEFLGKKMKESIAQSGRNVQARGFGDTLVLFNTIRQALLQQRLGNAPAELLAWQELQRLTQPNQKNSDTISHESLAHVLAVFKTGKIGLDDYIEARKKTLQQ